MKQFLLLLFLLISIDLFPQGEQMDKTFFSDALFMHLPDYIKKADQAYRYKNYEKGEELFKNLVQQNLEGTYMDNFKFHKINKKEVNLYDFKKPVFLITYASWCLPSKGEIPALNQLAEQYKNKVDFVVLYWDTREQAKEMAKDFNEYVSIVYVDETKNQGAYVVKQLKHSLGLPTCFLMSGDKQIMNIRRSVFPPLQTNEEIAYRENYKSIEASIAENLIKKYEDDYVENIILVD